MKNLYHLFSIALCCLANAAYAAEYMATIDLPPAQELSLPVSGVIKTLAVSPGQRVAMGKLMLALDPVPFNAAKSAARSHFAAQQTQLTESTRDLKQQQELYDRTVLAAVELEDAELRVERDRAILEKARAQLEAAEYALSYSQLTAPYDALVLSVAVNSGQSINNSLHSKTLVTLVQQDRYQASFEVEPAALESIDVGRAVKVVIRDKQYPATVSGIVYPQHKQVEADSRYLVNAVFAFDAKPVPLGEKASVIID